MPNDSLLIKRAIMMRDGMGKSFLDKKKKDLAEIDEYLKQPNDPEYKAQAAKYRSEIANKGYTKEEIEARLRRAKLQGMKK